MTAVWRHRNKLVLLAILAGGERVYQEGSLLLLLIIMSVCVWNIRTSGGYVGIRFIRKKLQDLQDRELTVQLRSTRSGASVGWSCLMLWMLQV